MRKSKVSAEKHFTYYKEIKVKTWAEFKEIVEKSKLEWIYRGQSNSEWELETTLQRSKIIDNFREFEDELLHDFKQGAKFYLAEEKLPSTKLEWFSMMQHFGAPSRLLDFTKSPYIAAYFAFEHLSTDAKEVSIWFVNKIYLWQKAMYYIKQKIDNPSYLRYTYDDKTFEKIYQKSKEGDFNCVVPIAPSNLNQRYYLQQSVFICQCNPYDKLINQLDFLGNLKQDTIMKITIPLSEKKIAIRDLIKMNVTRASLFPGLDGFAKSLFLKYENLSTFEESGKNLQYAKNKDLT